MDTEILSNHQERLTKLGQQVTMAIEPHASAIHAAGQQMLAVQERLANAVSGIVTNLPRLPEIPVSFPDLHSAFTLHELSIPIRVHRTTEQKIDHDLLAEKIAQRLRSAPQSGHKNRASYPLPKSANLAKLKFKQVDGHTVKVKYPGLPTQCFDYKDFGMENKKSHGPNAAWFALCKLFETNRIAGYNHKITRNTKYELNTCLKRFFETRENFFYPYNRKDHEWLAKPAFIAENDPNSIEND